MLLLNNRKYQIISINKDQFLDPRKMSEAELKSLGHVKKPFSKVIREMCNSCVSADPSVQEILRLRFANARNAKK